jgi:hypothetical protein
MQAHDGSGTDERLGPDLPRGRGKSFGGDRNLAFTTPRLRWLPTRLHMSWPHREGLFL